MKAAVKTADGDFKVEDVEKPKVTRADFVLAKVRVAGICGTDLRHWKVPVAKLSGRVVGHELAGEVVEVGSAVKNVQVGDRVVIETVLGDDTCEWCRVQEYNLCPALYEVRRKTVARAFAEYVVGPSKKFYKLPDSISFEEAALLDSAAVGLHACHVSGLKIDDKVVVIGCGPIGLTLLELVIASGAKALVTDVVDFPLKIAKELGADQAVNTRKDDGYRRVMEFTDGRGVDVCFECAGGQSMPVTLPEATRYTRIGGKVCLVGGFGPDTPPIKLDWERIQKAEIQLIPSASYAFWGVYSEMAMCIDLMAAKKLDVKRMITHRFPLEKINEAFEVTSDKENNNTVFTVIQIGD